MSIKYPIYEDKASVIEVREMVGTYSTKIIVVHSPVAFWKRFSPNGNDMGLWTDPTSKDGSFILTSAEFPFKHVMTVFFMADAFRVTKPLNCRTCMPDKFGARFPINNESVE